MDKTSKPNCWMLSLFFLYTVIVMSGVGIWTFIFGGN